MVFAKEEQAYDLLKKLDISYERLDHRAITSVQDLDFTLPGQQVKNLVLKTKKSRHFYMVILHDEKQANIADLAERLGEKRLSFASDEQLEELLHVPAGTVTPFGLMFDKDKRIQVVVDEDVDRSLTVGFHPFINSTTLNIAYSDFEKMMDYLDHTIRIVAC
ncbi:YbaK/EbsC family protein [Streptococcus minor]|uniref:YbaK/EbsC family protein n=1 Tax=Streptococcus minor TaxID=229549 RepID=UPI000368051B|nr:YbaK/EbsC family protein [Streptococcus minor]MDO5079188.1 YbaK/EbsC family protein [Streptococcus minor]